MATTIAEIKNKNVTYIQNASVSSKVSNLRHAEINNDIIDKLPTATTFTTTAIPLNNLAGAYNVSAASNASSYTIAAGAVLGGWAVVRINRATEPTISGATKIKGATFAANTDMYLFVENLGWRVEFYFAEI